MYLIGRISCVFHRYISDRWTIDPYLPHRRGDRFLREITRSPIACRKSPLRFRSRWTSNGIRNRSSSTPSHRDAIASFSFICFFSSAVLNSFTTRACIREAHACGSVQSERSRAIREYKRPRQGGVLSHPTWRFQFHFLSRRFPPPFLLPT